MRITQKLKLKVKIQPNQKEIGRGWTAENKRSLQAIQGIMGWDDRERLTLCSIITNVIFSVRTSTVLSPQRHIGAHNHPLYNCSFPIRFFLRGPQRHPLCLALLCLALRMRASLETRHFLPFIMLIMHSCVCECVLFVRGAVRV